MRPGFVSLLLVGLLIAAPGISVAQRGNQSLKIAIAGLSHGHVDSFLDLAEDNAEVEIVGIFDLDPELLDHYSNRFRIDEKSRYDTLSEMLSESQAHIVVAFSNTFDHLEIVEIAAPLGIDVILEKPLAVSLDHGI